SNFKGVTQAKSLFPVATSCVVAILPVPSTASVALSMLVFTIKKSPPAVAWLPPGLSFIAIIKSPGVTISPLAPPTFPPTVTFQVSPAFAAGYGGLDEQSIGLGGFIPSATAELSSLIAATKLFVLLVLRLPKSPVILSTSLIV